MNIILSDDNGDNTRASSEMFSLYMALILKTKYGMFWVARRRLASLRKQTFLVIKKSNVSRV